MVGEALARGSRITGAQRAELAAHLGRRYAAGESIRAIAEDAGRSFGFVHGLVKESGVGLRGRGGATRGAGARGAAGSSTTAGEPARGGSVQESRPKGKGKGKSKDASAGGGKGKDGRAESAGPKDGKGKGGRGKDGKGKEKKSGGKGGR